MVINQPSWEVLADHGNGLDKATPSLDAGCIDATNGLMPPPMRILSREPHRQEHPLMSHAADIAAIILAAGYSRRMGRFKPLLTLGGQTVLERVVSLYRKAGVRDICVVTGFNSAAVHSALDDYPVSVVHNPQYDKGMFSSVVAGVTALAADIKAFFVHPADIPLVRPHTLTMLMDAFHDHPSPVVYALFDDSRGHPPLVHGDLKTAILSHDGNGGLRGLLDHFDSKAMGVQVADEGVVMDMDTSDDFQCLATRLATATSLNPDECRVLMEKVQRLPMQLIDHCRWVARVAETLATAVNSNGGTLDPALVRSAALVHDVAKFENNHAAIGAGLLAEMGFPAVANIVDVHMDIDVSAVSALDEAQIVYLADKVMEGDKLMSLARRYDMKLKKYGHDPRVAEKIRRRWGAAMTIKTKVEQTTGVTIGQILKRVGTMGKGQSCATA